MNRERTKGCRQEPGMRHLLMDPGYNFQVKMTLGEKEARRAVWRLLHSSKQEMVGPGLGK